MRTPVSIVKTDSEENFKLGNFLSVLSTRIGFKSDPDSDPAFYRIVDPDMGADSDIGPDPDMGPDPGSQTNADPGGSGSWSDF